MTTVVVYKTDTKEVLAAIPMDGGDAVCRNDVEFQIYNGTEPIFTEVPGGIVLAENKLMFIVNQDRNTTINMGNVKEISLHGKQIFADDTVIGKYGTEERTDQVYNEMLQTLFSPYMMLKDAELPPDAMKNFANGNVILLKSADREPDVKFYDNGLYYMPEE